VTGLFDQFKDEESGSGGEMVEEKPETPSIDSMDGPAELEAYDNTEQEPGEINQDPHEYEGSQVVGSDKTENIGISSLMNKRAKLEEAVDYVGGLISQLKEKRTSLEKEIEDESVDIKNLKEKLIKVSDYISEETQGIQQLSEKRLSVEKEADDVGHLIVSLKEKLTGIDRIIEDEGSRIKNFRESRDKTSNI